MAFELDKATPRAVSIFDVVYPCVGGAAIAFELDRAEFACAFVMVVVVVAGMFEAYARGWRRQEIAYFAGRTAEAELSLASMTKQLAELQGEIDAEVPEATDRH